ATGAAHHTTISSKRLRPPRSTSAIYVAAEHPRIRTKQRLTSRRRIERLPALSAAGHCRGSYRISACQLDRPSADLRSLLRHRSFQRLLEDVLHRDPARLHSLFANLFPPPDREIPQHISAWRTWRPQCTHASIHAGSRCISLYRDSCPFADQNHRQAPRESH